MSRVSDSIKFVCKFAKSPKNIGAICPSSPFLGKCMAAHISDSFDDIVVELGPGTGAITAQLLKKGMNPEKLYCIEFDSVMCDTLKKRFPKCRIINGSAENIAEYLGKDIEKLSAIVSSLPLLSMPECLVENILKNVEEVLPSKGKFVQFTYNLKCNKATKRFNNMRHVKHSIVCVNVPPARVDVYEKI